MLVNNYFRKFFFFFFFFKQFTLRLFLGPPTSTATNTQVKYLVHSVSLFHFPCPALPVGRRWQCWAWKDGWWDHVKEEGEQVVTYEGRSLMQLHTTRDEGEDIVSLEDLRPTDWQGTDIEHLVDLPRNLDFILIPSDEIDFNQYLLKFRKIYCV